ADAELLVSRPVALVRVARTRRAPGHPVLLRVAEDEQTRTGCPIHRVLCNGWDEGCPIHSALFAEWVGVSVTIFGPDRRGGQRSKPRAGAHGNRRGRNLLAYRIHLRPRRVRHALDCAPAASARLPHRLPGDGAAAGSAAG